MNDIVEYLESMEASPDDVRQIMSLVGGHLLRIASESQEEVSTLRARCSDLELRLAERDVRIAELEHELNGNQALEEPPVLKGVDFG